MSARPITGAATLAGRIRLALLAVTMLAILVVTLGTMGIGYRAMHAQMQRHLRALATVAATQSEAALLFKDRGAALQVLQAIPPQEGVTVAELRDAAGAVVARIADHAGPLDGTPLGTLVRETAIEHVVVDGRLMGSVMLESGGEPLVRGLLSLLVLALLGALLTGAVIVVITRRLTQHITHPLTELEAVIRSARRERDFSRRAPPCGIAEIEGLRTDFHALLDEIQRRDSDLSRTHAILKRLALRDTLTGLPNRAMFERALLDALSGESGEGARAGLLYFDIDSFKSVNDALGHAIGDALLKGIAARLQERLPAQAMPARIGGDEFVVLISPISSEDEVRAFATALQEAIQAPMRIEAHLFHPGVSVGHAIPQAAASADQLIQVADQAMYSSKNKRRNAGIKTHWEPLPESEEFLAALSAQAVVDDWEISMKLAREAILFDK